MSTPLILFAHGNSFPGDTYQPLFERWRQNGAEVKALDRFGHDPRFVVSNNWPQLVHQWAAFVAQSAKGHAGPVYYVGHSMGGFISVMSAALTPMASGQAVAGVVVLDSPLLGGWKARAVAVAKHTQLVGALSPGRVSQKRRKQWASIDEVRAQLLSKPLFAAWSEEAREAYVQAGFETLPTPQGSHCVLRFDRDVETAVYNTLPHNLDRLLRRHPLQCPLAFIGGTQSTEVKQVGLKLTRKWVDSTISGRLQMIEGSHLFPMEQPEASAQAVWRALASFSAPQSAH